ncbi:LamG-like jellyroll fold domain-containing protein [Dactylosporangium sp. NPDC000244]|uniref:LamG-like jellyroll fold domain-containing protein n=1 Tax=Dactylosporangium sp. NPDC000244 TaxID=3154365 RepID=UPI00332FA93D
MDIRLPMFRAHVRPYKALGVLFALLSLMVTLLVAPPFAGPAHAAPKTPACPATAPDAKTARDQAAACKGRVEVLGGRTERAQVFANPNGTFTSNEAVVVQRVRTAGGGWTAPDSTLRKTSSGGYAPAASWLGTTFSGGGTGPLVTLRRGSGELSLSWPSALPEPKVAGNTATYPEVLPGVDLQLTAEVEGYSEVLVVKTPEAAKQPALENVRFRTATKGLKVKTGDSGSVSYLDGSGSPMFASGTPAMWDSSGGVPADARSATAQSRTARMPVTVEGGDVVVRPDLQVLRGGATKFPVFIDPAFNASAWTMINSRFTTQSYWSYDRNGCPAPFKSVPCAKVGYTDEGQTMIYRSIFLLPTASYVGKHVLDAKFSMDLLHSWTCSDTRTSLWWVGGIDANTTWSNHAGSWSSLQTFTDNHTCNLARVRSEWGITGLIQSAAGQYWNGVTIGLRAGDEANHNAWKKFDAGTALLTVTYNSYPNAPDQLTVSGSACATGAARPVVKTVTPELRARTSDADGTAQTHRVSFWWWPVGGTRNDNDKVTQTAVTPGTTAIVSIPPGKLVNDGVYQFQARSYDGTDDGQFSQVCEFKVDTAPPGPPSQVTSTDYPSDGQRHGGAGIGGTFKFFPPATVPSDFAGYAYTLDTGTTPPNAKQVAAATDNTATVSITPPTDDAFTLRVWTKDTGGSYSTPTTYAFSVKAGAGPDARWQLDEGSGTSAADSTGHGNPITLSNPSWIASRGGTGKALSFNGTNATGATGGPINTKSPTTNTATTVRTDANFTVTAWLKVDTLDPGGANYVAVSQDGTRTSAWTLGYHGSSNRWRFAMYGSDVDNVPVIAGIVSDGTPVAGKWTYIVATYDASTHTLRMYVDGVLQTGSLVLSGGFNATGPVVLGRRKWNGGNDSFFKGGVDDVRIYARVVPAADPELTNQLNPEKPTITIPAGQTPTVNQPLQVTFSGGGDPAVTAIKYSLGAAGLGSTATLPTPGGQVTVTVTPPAMGQVTLFAAAVAGTHQSDIATAFITVGTPPAITGTVVDPVSGNAVSGATVTLRPSGTTRVTDAFGVYEFTGLTPGTYTVSTAVGDACGLYASTEVEVTGQTYVDLLLFPQSDVFGYTCLTQTQAFEPGDTLLGLSGDDSVTQVSVPFAMPFYGHNSSTAWVSTNGFLAFADPSAAGDAAAGAAIPQSAAPNALVAPFWTDLVVDGSASVYTKTDGAFPNRRFIVEWRNVALFASSKRVTFEAILSENGDIAFNYADIDADDAERGGEATVGIESTGGEYGLQYAFHQPILESGKAVLIDYPLDAQPIGTGYVTGTVTRNGTPAAGLTVSLQPQGLTTTTANDGTYAFAAVEEGGFSVSTVDGCATATASGHVSGPTVANLALAAVPDEFGYTCTTSTQAFVPADTTVLPIVDDDAHTQVTLPFPVTFYGQTYTGAWVSANGFVSFTDPGYENPDVRAALPNATGPNAALYPFWDDLVLDGNSSVRTAVVGSAPNRKFVVEWRDMYLFGNTSRRVTVEAIIAENGTITFNYAGLDNAYERGLGTVVGIENADGTIGQTYSAFRDALADGRAITYTPPAA